MTHRGSKRIAKTCKTCGAEFLVVPSVRAGAYCSKPCQFEGQRVHSKDDQPNPSGLCQCGCGERTPLANHSDQKKGWVKGTPVRFLPYHHNRLRRNVSMPDKFTVDPISGCWNWHGSRTIAGYGHFLMNNIAVYAHRASYEHAYGTLGDGLEVHHKCENPSCVNPDHLEALTHREHMEADGRLRQSTAEK